MTTRGAYHVNHFLFTMMNKYNTRLVSNTIPVSLAGKLSHVEQPLTSSSRPWQVQSDQILLNHGHDLSQLSRLEDAAQSGLRHNHTQKENILLQDQSTISQECS